MEMVLENESLTILSTLAVVENLVIWPLKWLDLRFISEEYNIMSDISYSILLSERLMLSMFEIQFQNQVRSLLEIFYIFWVWPIATTYLFLIEVHIVLTINFIAIHHLLQQKIKSYYSEKILMW